MIINFPSTQQQAFTFQCTLDGGQYSASIWWNIGGQRWYITLSDLSGNIIFTQPLIASPVGTDLSITIGYFTSKIIYRNEQITII